MWGATRRGGQRHGATAAQRSSSGYAPTGSFRRESLPKKTLVPWARAVRRTQGSSHKWVPTRPACLGEPSRGCRCWPARSSRATPSRRTARSSPSAALHAAGVCENGKREKERRISKTRQCFILMPSTPHCSMRATSAFTAPICVCMTFFLSCHLWCKGIYRVLRVNMNEPGLRITLHPHIDVHPLAPRYVWCPPFVVAW